MESQGKFIAVLTVIFLVSAGLLVSPRLETIPDVDNWGIEVHLEHSHYDRYGALLSRSFNPGNLTDYGANWIADVLGDADGDQGDYIGLTNTTNTYNDTWVVLDDEITTEGMTRAIGSYVDTGTGTWNITNTFSITGSNSTQRAGLYHNVAGSTLIATDTFALTNVENGDSLQIVFMITVTD